MSLNHKALDQMTAQDLAELVENKVLEDRFVEYKAGLPADTADAKKKFLAAVSSFANSSGGTLILGIKEDKRTPVELCGVGPVNADQVKQRLDSLVRDGINPRIPGVAIREVAVAGGSLAFVIRVPRSWAAPHMVTLAGHDRFYIRDSSGKHPMDVGELRVAFGLADTITERIRRFRLDRLALIESGDTPVPLNPGPKVVLHLIPFGAFDPSVRIDPGILDASWSELRPLNASGWNHRFNIDGYLTFCVQSETTASSYLQVFRSGAIETVDCDLLARRGQLSPAIPSTAFEKELLVAISGCKGTMARLALPPPFVVALTLTDMRGYHMYTSSAFGLMGAKAVDRDVLLVPEALVEDPDARTEDIARPLIDAIWNATGYARSPNFDENGEWKPR